ncbi:MAG TPA: glycoside hydrolase family 95 protein, partial [Phnomibacter sp.]|nr:glycoside hydrolase family 95 protein [Phnomibacter sp.]
MYTKFSLILITGLLAIMHGKAQTNPNLMLWYNKPATVWEEALPVGNGKMGAMIFGGAQEELLQLNESTLWSGGPVKPGINLEASQYLPQIRQALINEKNYTRADLLTRKMQGVYTQSYLPMADVRITQTNISHDYEAYHRMLNLENAMATTRFKANGVEYMREIFISAPMNVLVVRITANTPGAVHARITTTSLLRHQLLPNGNAEIVVNGKAPAHADPNYY